MKRYEFSYDVGMVESDDGSWIPYSELGLEHPEPPAIPEEVRKAIEVFIDEPCRCVGMVDVCPDCDAANVLRVWLASAPVATGKATCPKCGDRRERVNVGDKSVFCHGCQEWFDVQVLIISPPRTEKGDK
jgi:hypothetical protein